MCKLFKTVSPNQQHNPGGFYCLNILIKSSNIKVITCIEYNNNTLILVPESSLSCDQSN